MIRYRCIQCGKSLKAPDAIIGRKARCSKCGSIEEVPPFSTRKSRSRAVKDRQNEIVSVDSDSFFDLEDVRSLKSSKLIGGATTPEVENEPRQIAPKTQATTDVGMGQEFRPIFKRVQPNRKPSQIIVAIVAGLMITCAAVFVLMGSLGSWDRQEEARTAFDQTKEMVKYENALFDLKKAQRVMLIISDGYLSAKGVEKSELGDLDQFVASLDEVTMDESAIVAARELFETGDKAEASRRVAESTKLLTQLRQEVARRTEDLRTKTYQQ